jgi:hypothetical protein
MSDQGYYNNQYPPHQQGYGDPGAQNYNQPWQQSSGPPHGYGDQSYNQGYDQSRPYDYNGPPHQNYQQPYNNPGEYQVPLHEQYPQHQNQYTSLPPEGYQHHSDQYGAPPNTYPPHNQYVSSTPDSSYQNQNYPHQTPDYNSGYGDQTQRGHSPYPQPPTQTQYNDYTAPAGPPPGQTNPGYPQAGAPFDPNDPNATQDRGLMGAVAGGALGAYGGHKVHHGFLGAVGGAIAGSLAEDALKKKNKEKKAQRIGGRRDSSSSSSSSSDDEKKKKKYGLAAAGVAGTGAAAYAMHQKPHSPARQPMRGNFSASSTSITLDKDYDLIASCTNVRGEHKLSSISLNQCLTNSHGHFGWFKGGNFGASARNVRLIEGGRVLEAELGTGGGGWNWDRIRLDERISNNDGDLVFLQ